MNPKSYLQQHVDVAFDVQQLDAEASLVNYANRAGFYAKSCYLMP